MQTNVEREQQQNVHQIMKRAEKRFVIHNGLSATQRWDGAYVSSCQKTGWKTHKEIDRSISCG